MARLVTSGAEWRSVSASDATSSPDGQSSGTTVSIDTSLQRSGSACWKHVTAATNSLTAFGFTGALLTTYYARAYVMTASQAETPTGNITIAQFMGSAVSLLSVKIGTISATGFTLRENTSATESAAEIPFGTYGRLEMSLNINSAAGADDVIELRLDGVTWLTVTRNAGTAAPDTLRVGLTQSSTGTLYVDDVAVNDSTGASQNTFPGSEKIVLQKPISDSAVGTGWTLGTGTAIAANSGSTAVKNTPPVGVADLTAGSDTKQIRNASSNANVNYDANLTTYTTAGIGASDTVNVLVPMVATGAPVVTSAKSGTIGISSNPVIANVALGAGGTAGTFWSGVAAGTYPTGWKWSFGTTTYAPTVTLGSSPVARITQVTASTRIADVCAIGMYVGYTPAVVATVMPPKPTVVRQAISRAANW